MMQNKILITIDRDIMAEYMKYYFKQHPTAKTFPFCSKKVEKLFNKDGSPQLTKGGNHKTKSSSRHRKEIELQHLDYGVLSLNELLVIPDRFMMNNLKQQWSDFGLWLSDYYGITGKMYTNAVIEVIVYGATNANRDNDNTSAGVKFLNDALFVKSKAFTDDNFKVINPLVLSNDTDKNHPRTEILISLCNDDIKHRYDKLQIHINNWR